MKKTNPKIQKPNIELEIFKKIQKDEKKGKKISFWRLKKIEKRKTSSNFQKVH